MGWTGVWAVYEDQHLSLQPCDSNIFSVLAELRKCGLTDSETCLKSVTLSLGGGKTVSISGELKRARAGGILGGGGKSMSTWPVTWVHTLNSECIHYLGLLLGTLQKIAGVWLWGSCDCTSWKEDSSISIQYNSIDIILYTLISVFNIT